MRLYIQSVNARHDKGPSSLGGKGPRIETDNFKITDFGDDGLHIAAECSEIKGTGTRGGDPKKMNRRLNMILDKKDLQRILDAAIEARLVSLPGLQSFIEAKKHL